jgi:hypothetical protein
LRDSICVELERCLQDSNGQRASTESVPVVHRLMPTPKE